MQGHIVFGHITFGHITLGQNIIYKSDIQTHEDIYELTFNVSMM